jgi:hydroxymethylpyrimidine/phosphomethylpyrimidine kinase
VPNATALTIAGSDSSGGAGIQADLKTMAAFGVYGATALTSVTAQNTLGVRGVVNLPPEFVEAQIDAVMEDVGADAAKTGMLATRGIIEAVADRVRSHAIPNLVVDPVMVATSGASLIEEDAVRAMADAVVPLAYVVTPNLREAEILSGIGIDSDAAVEEAARAIHGLGGRNVLIKGGHLEGAATDVLFDGSIFVRYTVPRVPVGDVHGTGCTLSAAIASALALGLRLPEAVEAAKRYVTRGIATSFGRGKGSALLNHFASPWDDVEEEASGS